MTRAEKYAAEYAAWSVACRAQIDAHDSTSPEPVCPRRPSIRSRHDYGRMADLNVDGTLRLYPGDWRDQDALAVADFIRENFTELPTPQAGQPITWDDHERISRDGP